MKNHQKIVYLIFFMSLLFILIFFNFYKIHPYLIEDYLIEIPIQIQDGNEIQSGTYKYSNNSGLIILTKSKLSCEWKPDNEDDGWKNCEAIFEVINPVILENKKELNFIFEFEKDNIKNIEVSYSNNFKVIEEDETTLEKKGFEKIENLNKKYYPEKKLNKAEEIIIKKQKIEKRVYYDFSENLPLKKEILKTTNDDLNLSVESDLIKEDKNKEKGVKTDEKNIELKKENEFLEIENNEDLSEKDSLIKEENKTNKIEEGNLERIEKEVSYITEYSQEENQNKSISGFIIKMIKKDIDKKIDLSKPFAIKVNFEMPKTDSNSFDFKIISKDFQAYIDPEIAPCGDFKVPNTTYYLEDSFDAGYGRCFNILAENITLNCLGYEINSDGGDYVIYTNSSGTKIKNCRITGNFLEIYGGGIFLNEAEGSVLENNYINISGNSISGITIVASKNFSILKNNITLNGENVEGVILDSGCDNSELKKNNINLKGDYSKGIHIEGFSENFTIFENNIKTDGEESSGIFAFHSENLKIKDNSIEIFGTYSPFIEIYYGNNLYIEDNNFLSKGTDSSGIFSAFSDNLILNSNIFVLEGSSNYGIYLYETFNSNYSKNEFEIKENANNGINIGPNSNNNIFDENNFSIFGNDCNAFYIEESSCFNQFTNNNIYLNGNYSNCFLISNEANSNIFKEDLIIDYGFQNKIFNFQSNTYGNFVENISIYSQEGNLIDIQINGNNNKANFMEILKENGINMLVESGTKDNNFTFINTSPNKIDFLGDSEANIFFGNLLNIYVKYENSSTIENVLVNIYDSLENLIYSNYTNYKGELLNIFLPFYVQLNQANKTYYYNYLINVTKRGKSNFSFFNISEKKELEFILNTDVNLEHIVEKEQDSFGGSYNRYNKTMIEKCIENLYCTPWSDCIDQLQVRNCYDINNCNKIKVKQERKCNIEKIPMKKISEREILFDVVIKILDKKIKKPKITFAVSLINVGVPGRVYGNLTYRIFNSKNELVYIEKEIVPVETQIEFIKEIEINNLEYGEYEIFVDLEYPMQKEEAIAKEKFILKKPYNIDFDLIFNISILFILLLILIKLRLKEKHIFQEKQKLEVKE